MTSTDLVRSSRDGDQFHYYWAARQCLKLLLPGSGLAAVSIEGSSPQDPGAAVEQAADDDDADVDPTGEYVVVDGAGPSTGPMLRSRSPLLVRQELAAWALAGELVRGLVRDAAHAAAPARKGRRAGPPVHPRQLSFTAARRAAITSIRQGTAAAGLPAATVAAGTARVWHGQPSPVSGGRPAAAAPRPRGGGSRSPRPLRRRCPPGGPASRACGLRTSRRVG
jgi:hypothetical protein